MLPAPMRSNATLPAPGAAASVAGPSSAMAAQQAAQQAQQGAYYSFRSTAAAEPASGRPQAQPAHSAPPGSSRPSSARTSVGGYSTQLREEREERGGYAGGSNGRGVGYPAPSAPAAAAAAGRSEVGRGSRILSRLDPAPPARARSNSPMSLRWAGLLWGGAAGLVRWGCTGCKGRHRPGLAGAARRRRLLWVAQAALAKGGASPCLGAGRRTFMAR